MNDTSSIADAVPAAGRRRWEAGGAALGLLLGTAVWVLWLMLQPTPTPVSPTTAATATSVLSEEDESGVDLTVSPQGAAFARLAKAQLRMGRIADAATTLRKAPRDEQDALIERLFETIVQERLLQLPDALDEPEELGATPAPQVADAGNRLSGGLIATRDLAEQIQDPSSRSRHLALLAELRQKVELLLPAAREPATDDLIARSIEAANMASAAPREVSKPQHESSRRPAWLGLLIALSTTLGGYLSGNLFSSAMSESGKAIAGMIVKRLLDAGAAPPAAAIAAIPRHENAIVPQAVATPQLADAGQNPANPSV